MPVPLQYLTISLSALFLLSNRAAGQRPADLTPFFIADRNADVALARSAAPRSITDSATVVLLTATGFVEAVQGSNGFTCTTLPGFFAGIGDPEFWNSQIRAPICFNPAASRSILPGIRQRAAWIIAGVTPDEIQRRTLAAYASHHLPLPEAGAMSYMLSPRQFLVVKDPRWMPHLMFYYDARMPGSAWGAGGMSSPIIDASAGDSTAAVRTLLIPVRLFSDGTPSPMGTH